jgi:hypothetical protein
MAKTIKRKLIDGSTVLLTGIARIRVEMVGLVIATAPDKQTEGALLNLIEELADESEKRGYDQGYHAGYSAGVDSRNDQDAQHWPAV